MHMLNAVAASILLLQPTAAAITADYHTLTWKHGNSNFWAPLGLDTKTYALESPAGAAPDALNKRGDKGSKSTSYLPCTVVTVDGELSGTTLDTLLEKYRALKDDVWSEEQVSTKQNMIKTLLICYSSWSVSMCSLQKRWLSIKPRSRTLSRTVV